MSIAAERMHERGVDRVTTRPPFHRARVPRVDELERCSADALRRQLRQQRLQWHELDSALRRMDLRLRLSEARRRHHMLSECMQTRVATLVKGSRSRLESLSTQLSHLSPLNVLERGYAIVHDSAGNIVRSPSQLTIGAELAIRLAQGKIKAQVSE